MFVNLRAPLHRLSPRKQVLVPVRVRRRVKNSEILYAIDFTAPYTNDYETTEHSDGCT